MKDRQQAAWRVLPWLQNINYIGLLYRTLIPVHTKKGVDIGVGTGHTSLHHAVLPLST